MAPKLTVPYFLETYVTLYDVLVRFFTETELIGCVCVCKVIQRERDFKLWARAIVEAGKSKICRVAGRLETQERAAA